MTHQKVWATMFLLALGLATARAEDAARNPAKHGLFVAVGYGGFRGWSVDGKQWSAERWSPKSEDDPNIISSLVYRDGIFLCSGGGVGRGFILRSTDGKNWNEVVGVKWRIALVTSMGDHFYSAYDDHLQESADGVTWKALGEAKPVAPDGVGGGYFRRCAVGNGAIVFAGDYGLPDRQDRIGWIGGVVGDNKMNFEKQSRDVRGLAFGNGRFIGCTLDGNVIASSTGRDFKVIATTGDEHDDDCVKFRDGKFYLFGRKGARVSDDGEKWTDLKSPPRFPRAVSPDGVAVDCDWGGIRFSLDGKTYEKASIPVNPVGVTSIIYAVPLENAGGGK